MASVVHSRLIIPATPRTASRAGAIVAVALHVAAVAALLTYEPARRAISEAAPIMVELIKPRVETPPPPKSKPKPLEMKPQPVQLPQPLPEPPPPVLTAAPTAPSPVLAPPPPPPIIAAPPAPPAPPAVTAPVFDAAYLNNPAPRYPALSRRLGEQGRVTLRVVVNPAGRADSVQVRTSSGFARLDESAVEAVKTWRFVPAKRGNEAITDTVLVPIPFILE